MLLNFWGLGLLIAEEAPPQTSSAFSGDAFGGVTGAVFVSTVPLPD